MCAIRRSSQYLCMFDRRGAFAIKVDRPTVYLKSELTGREEADTRTMACYSGAHFLPDLPLSEFTYCINAPCVQQSE